MNDNGKIQKEQQKRQKESLGNLKNMSIGSSAMGLICRGCESVTILSHQAKEGFSH